jgi:hypothetical protein
VKQQATMAKAQLDAQTDIEKAKIQAQTDLTKAQMQMETQKQIALLKVQGEADISAAQLAHADLDREDTQRFEHAEASVDRHHESVLKAADHAQAEAQAEQVHKQGMEAGEIAHGQNIDLMEREPKAEGE